MNVPLRERNLDAGFAEGLVDSKVEVTGDAHAFVDILDKAAQLEIQGTVAELPEQYPGPG